MIKKWNAVCSWMLTLFLLGHMLTMSIPVLTGGQDYSDCQILAGGIVATVLIHVVLCIVSYYPRRGVLNFHRYRKENWRLITQRISGIVILILLYPHMRVLHLIISGASFSGRWSKVSCISDGDSLCRCGISASECIVQPFYADAWFVEER